MPSVDVRRSELGDFLRTRRERLQPASPAGDRRRRTPGLRREEVAELAGIGVDWYIRLEQGRRVNPSRATVDAIARALRLTKAEHAHLRSLSETTERPSFAREIVPPALARMLAALTTPAYITGRRWDVLAANAAAEEIFGFERLSEDDRNILVVMLTDARTRALFGDGWAAEAQRMVAQFRVTADLWSGEPRFVALLERLRNESDEFAPWWDDHRIRPVAGGEKTMSHPRLGALRFEHASFQSNDDPALKLVIYTPASDAAA